MSEPAALYSAIRDEVQTVLLGNEDIVEGLTVALLTNGHVLLEGVPGIAKTTIAVLFSEATGLTHSRIQMTPDILPADITGTNVYRESTGTFETRKGPVFANVVLADEINRATPKAQSALLEAMAERQVTIEGETHALPSPFLLIATQNPIEMEGTYTLPEAQRDRFQLKLTMGLPDRETERALLDRFDATPELAATDISQVVSPDDILAARDAVNDVHVAPEIKQYVLDIVAASRSHSSVEHGASPRASLAFLKTGKARAAIHGREYVIPDDIKTLAHPVLLHRLLLNADAEIGGVDTAELVYEIVDSVQTPDGLDQDTPGDASAISDGGNG
ncbi:MoxR family ATPase [Natronomonas salina]|uniref:AAA family ATPase n=1 Tax=Natronomonas salina TaxID=1710540 RepID=UPI0015B5648B|nr:MoxR family ATPase [Natronomonas salina]QLD88744.1 MoxR family ATPase [Natronomonas salina]